MVKRNGKRDVKVEFLGSRFLTDDEARAIRELAASFNPRVHLVLPAWPFCEVRGVSEQRAAQLIKALKPLPGVRFNVI